MLKFLSVVFDLVAAGFEIRKIISQDGKTFSDENHSEEYWKIYPVSLFRFLKKEASMDPLCNRLQKDRNRERMKERKKERKKERIFYNIKPFAFIYKCLKYDIDNQPLIIL